MIKIYLLSLLANIIVDSIVSAVTLECWDLLLCLRAFRIPSPQHYKGLGYCFVNRQQLFHYMKIPDGYEYKVTNMANVTCVDTDPAKKTILKLYVSELSITFSYLRQTYC